MNLGRFNFKPLPDQQGETTRRADKSFRIKTKVMLSKVFPDPEIYDLSNDELKPKVSRNRMISAITSIPQLNELITLKKIANTENNGILKRVLHTPTFKIYDIMVDLIYFIVRLTF